MSIISVVGPKGGIGKTTISINTTAALTRALGAGKNTNRICLVDLDLRLPTITSLLDSHPAKTFYDLFECLGNKVYQVDFLRTFYQLVTWFESYIDGDISASHDKLVDAFHHYKSMNTGLFLSSGFKFGDAIEEMLIQRSEIKTLSGDQIHHLSLRQGVELEFCTVDETLIRFRLDHLADDAMTLVAGRIGDLLQKPLHISRPEDPFGLVA